MKNFSRKNDTFLIFAPNIDCGYKIEPPRRCEAVLTSTHNLCFVAKIRKIGLPLHSPVLLYKSWVSVGIYFTDLFSFSYIHQGPFPRVAAHTLSYLNQIKIKLRSFKSSENIKRAT